MAQCKMCGRKGFLLSVSANGLCKSCDPIVVMDVQQRGRIINDCMKLIDKSENIKTRLSRCDLLIEHAQALLEYEHKGIPTVNPSPSQLLSEYTTIHAQLGGEESVEKPRSNKDVEMSENIHDKRKAECPYCHKALPKIPSRKTKCPSCGEFIYVRTRPSDRQRILATEEDAKRIDEEWKSKQLLERLSVSQKEYQNTEKELTKKFKTAPSQQDVVWAVLNERLLSAMKKSDWQEMKMLYWEQARLLYEQGREFFKLLQEAARCELRNYQASGVVKKVEILTAGDQSCEKCNVLSGKVLTIKAALDTMPIPVKDCGNDSWCRCMYLAVVE